MSLNSVFAVMLMFTFLFGIYNSRKILARTKTRVIETAKLNNFISSEFPGTDIILSADVSNEYTGLLLAYNYSGENVKEIYKKIISTKYPEQVWYDIFSDRIYSIKDSFKAIDEIRSGRFVLYQTMDSQYNKNFLENLKANYGLNEISLTEVFSNNNGELLYRLDQIR